METRIWAFDDSFVSVPMGEPSWRRHNDSRYGMTIVDFKKFGYKDEPFVLAKYVAQVFYVKRICQASLGKIKPSPTTSQNAT